MPLVDTVTRDIAEAMRAKDTTRLGALRLLKTALVNREVERGRPLTEAEALQVVASVVKQRKDSIEQFLAAGRSDLEQKERAELRVIEAYQPPAVDTAELDGLVAAVVAELGASSPRDMGRVMKAVMERLAGRTADGKLVSDLVKKRLAG